MDTENVEIIKAMVKTGLGIGIVPYQAIAREVRAGQFFCARIEGHELVRETGWVYARANRVPRMIHELLDGVRRDQGAAAARAEAALAADGNREASEHGPARLARDRDRARRGARRSPSRSTGRGRCPRDGRVDARATPRPCRSDRRCAAGVRARCPGPSSVTVSATPSVARPRAQRRSRVPRGA